MRSLLLCAPLLALGVLSLSLVACDGGDGSSCVIDSDCPDFRQACIEGVCRVAGEVPEAGTGPMDAGEGMDSGPEPTDSGPPVEMDAAPMDAAPADAMPTDGMVADAEPADAMPTDAPAPVCETVGANWVVALVTPSVTCSGATSMSTLTIMENAGDPCTFTMSSAGATAITGTFTLAEDNMLLGTLSPGMGAAMSCSGTYTPATPAFTVICGGCVMNLNIP